MKNLFDTYTIYARFFPAIVSALPLFVLWFFLSRFGELNDLMSFILSLKFIGSLTLGAVFLYFYAQLIRTTSIFLEKRYFLNSQGFPTTYLMMYKDTTFSKEYKDAYRQLVRTLLRIEIPDETQEKRDPGNAKKRLDEVTKLVIIHVGKGKLVLKHNIWYGFFRNLAGGMFFSTLFCILNICIGLIWLKSITLWVSSAVLLICFGMVLLFHKPILMQHAEAYAKQLIAEFMMTDRGEQGTTADHK